MKRRNFIKAAAAVFAMPVGAFVKNVSQQPNKDVIDFKKQTVSFRVTREDFCDEKWQNFLEYIKQERDKSRKELAEQLENNLWDKSCWRYAGNWNGGNPAWKPVDIPSWDCSNVTNMSSMFRNCHTFKHPFDRPMYTYTRTSDSTNSVLDI